MFDGFRVKHQIRTGSSSNVVCGKRCMFWLAAETFKSVMRIKTMMMLMMTVMTLMMMSNCDCVFYGRSTEQFVFTCLAEIGLHPLSLYSRQTWRTAFHRGTCF